MSDPAIIDAATHALIDELSEVSDSMIEAASKAETKLLLNMPSSSKRALRLVPESHRYAVLWRAMLAAKLGERA